jgi:3-oxoacyl-[acyl-carrier protein] reductase
VAVHHSSESSRAKADELVAELTKHQGVRAARFQADLSSYEEAKKLHDEVVAKLGHPDIFFGNHGSAFKIIGPNGNIGDIDYQMFEQTWRLNTGTNYYVGAAHVLTHRALMVALQLTQLCIPHMEKQKWGRIVLTSR